MPRNSSKHRDRVNRHIDALEQSEAVIPFLLAKCEDHTHPDFQIEAITKIPHSISLERKHYTRAHAAVECARVLVNVLKFPGSPWTVRETAVESLREIVTFLFESAGRQDEDKYEDSYFQQVQSPVTLFEINTVKLYILRALCSIVKSNPPLTFVRKTAFSISAIGRFFFFGESCDRLLDILETLLAARDPESTLHTLQAWFKMLRETPQFIFNVQSDSFFASKMLGHPKLVSALLECFDPSQKTILLAALTIFTWIVGLTRENQCWTKEKWKEIVKKGMLKTIHGLLAHEDEAITTPGLKLVEVFAGIPMILEDILSSGAWPLILLQIDGNSKPTVSQAARVLSTVIHEVWLEPKTLRKLISEHDTVPSMCSILDQHQNESEISSLIVEGLNLILLRFHESGDVHLLNDTFRQIDDCGGRKVALNLRHHVDLNLSIQANELLEYFQGDLPE